MNTFCQILEEYQYLFNKSLTMSFIDKYNIKLGAKRGSLIYMNLIIYLPDASSGQYSILSPSGILQPVKYVIAQFPFILVAHIINKNPGRYKPNRNIKWVKSNGCI